jgi:hypothetical protein
MIAPQEYYLMGQMTLVALLLPYSGYALLLIGSALLVLGILYRRGIWSWFNALPVLVRIGLGVLLLLESIPALVVGLGVGARLGLEVGIRLGRALLPMTVATIGQRIAGVAGTIWGFAASILAMEALAALVGATIIYLMQMYRSRFLRHQRRTSG